MAGFDWELQRSAHIPNLMVNAGQFDFSAGSNTADVPTTLSHVMGAVVTACLSSTTDPQVTFVGYLVGDASNGAVTFIRGGGVVFEDARMSYLAFGY